MLRNISIKLRNIYTNLVEGNTKIFFAKFQPINPYDFWGDEILNKY